MSENASNPSQNPTGPQIVTFGNVVSAFMSEINGLVYELAQHRVLADDLRAWFDAHPDLSERFGAFQHARAKSREKARAGKQNRAKPAKR